MFKACCASIAAALLTGTAVTAVAQSPAAPTQTQPAASTKAANSDEIVCQKQEVTGSRVGFKRVCMTRSQWADRRLQDRQELERVQVQRGGKAE